LFKKLLIFITCEGFSVEIKNDQPIKIDRMLL